MAKTQVVNVKSLGKQFVYIGRGSPWGNPFVVGKDGDRTTVIAKYRRRLWSDKAMMDALPTLKGKKLICFCSPEKCHGDVLVAAIAWQESGRQKAAAEARSERSQARQTESEVQP